MPVLSGLIVSIDAFFIGLSLGMQKKCKYLYLVIINAVLLGLCILGFFIAGQVYELIEIDTDILVGVAFIALGIWTISHYFIAKQLRRKKNQPDEESCSIKTIILIGTVMSLEAMLITMGLTFIFQPNANLLIPLTVALAHFGYSTLSFFLARTKHIKRIPASIAHIISGSALIIYGLMAIFIEFGM